jgi:hypothetical protein
MVSLACVNAIAAIFAVQPSVVIHARHLKIIAAIDKMTHGKSAPAISHQPNEQAKCQPRPLNEASCAV